MKYTPTALIINGNIGQALAIVIIEVMRLSDKREDKDMAMPQPKMEEMKEINMKKLEAMLKRGKKRYDKGLSKLAKN